MDEIIQIVQTEINVRIFSVGNGSFFIEDWNKKQLDEINKNEIPTNRDCKVKEF